MQDDLEYPGAPVYQAQAASARVRYSASECKRAHSAKVWTRVPHLVALPGAVVPVEAKEVQHGVFCGAGQSPKQACSTQQLSEEPLAQHASLAKLILTSILVFRKPCSSALQAAG